MKYQLLTATLCTFLITVAKAEDNFMHSIDATIAFMTSKSPYSNAANSSLHTNFTYSPRLLVTQSEKSSVSVGTPVINWRRKSLKLLGGMHCTICKVISPSSNDIFIAGLFSENEKK